MCPYLFIRGFPGGSEGKASAYNAGDLGSVPGWGRSPGEGNGNPLQYYYLENPMDGEAWWATVHGVAKSQTQLSNFTLLILMTSNLHPQPRPFLSAPGPDPAVYMISPPGLLILST